MKIVSCVCGHRLVIGGAYFCYRHVANHNLVCFCRKATPAEVER